MLVNEYDLGWGECCWDGVLGKGTQVGQLITGMSMGLEKQAAKTLLSKNVNERIGKVDNFPDE